MLTPVKSAYRVSIALSGSPGHQIKRELLKYLYSLHGVNHWEHLRRLILYQHKSETSHSRLLQTINLDVKFQLQEQAI